VSGFALPVPDELVELVAERAAELVLERQAEAPASPYLNVDEAAEYLRCDRQRIYDLLSARRLSKSKDGARVLLLREELDAYIGVAPLLPPGSRSGSGRRVAA
jgi:excisionase family DNA binding protein